MFLALANIILLREEIRWWDYPGLQRLLNAAPQWWIEHVMKGYK